MIIYEAEVLLKAVAVKGIGVSMAFWPLIVILFMLE